DRTGAAGFPEAGRAERVARQRIETSNAVKRSPRLHLAVREGGQREIDGQENAAALGPVLHAELVVAAEVGVDRRPAGVEVVADLWSDGEGPALDIAERLRLALVRRELQVGVADC